MSSGGPSDLDTLAASVLAQARAGEEMEVYVARGTETEVRAYSGAVESLSSATSAGIGVRIFLPKTPEGSEPGGRMGFAWAGSLDPEVVAATLEEARDNARYATVDPDVDLARPDGVAPADLDLYAPDAARVSTDHKVHLALDLERRARAADPRIRQVSSADYGDATVESALYSTTGIRAASRRSTAFVSVGVIAGEGDDSQTGSGFSVGRSPSALDVEHAATQAAERATRLLGARKVPSARMAVVFDPRVVSTILGVLSAAFSGEAVVKGRSFFADRLGEQVGTDGLTLVDDPTDPRAYGAASFDGEGLACRRNVLIGDGVLRGFVYDTVAARRAGAASTGSAVRGGYAGTPGAGCRALLLEPGSEGPESILRSVDRGLYVQSVTGVHSGVNSISGDFSVGAEGLVIRHGQLAEPVREVTVASTLQKMLLSVLAVGADVEFLPGLAAGQTVAVADMQVSGD